MIDRDVRTVPVAELNSAAQVWTLFGARLSQDKRTENCAPGVLMKGNFSTRTGFATLVFEHHNR